MRELPAGWGWTTLGDACEITQGQSPPGSSYNTVGQGLPFFQGKTDFGEIHPSPRNWCSAPQKLAVAGEILISIRAPVGPTNIAAEPCCIGRGLAALRARDDIHQRYVLHWLRLSEPELGHKARGSTFASITGTQLAAHPLPLAPLTEQRRIVNEIDQYFASIDATAGQLIAVRQKTATFAMSVIRAATLAKSHWRIARAGEVCNFITKGTTPASGQLLAQGEVPFLKVNNLSFGGPLDFSRSRTFVSKDVHDKELSRSKVRPGDVLMNIVGPPLGKVAIVPDTYPEYNINQAIARFRPVSGVDARYLALLLRNPEILAWALKRAKTTAGQVNLTLELCRDLPLPIAPETEQQQIASAVEQALLLSDNSCAGIDAALGRAARLRQAILKKAFEGKLVPQDPNDEPASVLLERIRTARAETPARRAPRKREVYA